MRPDIAQALADGLISVNEMDTNFENANVVDACFFLGRAIKQLARAVEKHGVGGGVGNQPGGDDDLLQSKVETEKWMAQTKRILARMELDVGASLCPCAKPDAP